MTDNERRARNREKTARYRVRHRERVLAQGRAQSKKWHAAHRDESIAASRAYYLAHRDSLREKSKAKRSLQTDADLAERRADWQQNKARQNAQRRARYAANREAFRERDRKLRQNETYRSRAVARTAEWNRKNPERAKILRRKQDAKRRAIERECFVEAVDPRVVFERDQGICGICREQVDPMSPWEMDHIAPILRGGEHSYANVQLAHRRCNRSKGAKCA